MIILVTGASGMLGRYVFTALERCGVDARGTGRSDAPSGMTGTWFRADLLTGAGIVEAVAGASAVIHCASNPRRPDDDLPMLHHLLGAMRSAGGHLVHVGIAGIEEAAEILPYYRVKLECERRIEDSGIPHTICRATQFHPFVEYALRRLSFGSFQLMPPMRLQPVDPRFAAERLADLATAAPLGRSPDLCGPEALSIAELVRPWLLARGQCRLRVPIPGMGPFAAWNRLRLVAGEIGGVSWREWLAKA